MLSWILGDAHVVGGGMLCFGRGAYREVVSPSWGCPSKLDVGRVGPLRPGVPAVLGSEARDPHLALCCLSASSGP